MSLGHGSSTGNGPLDQIIQAGYAAFTSALHDALYLSAALLAGVIDIRHPTSMASPAALPGRSGLLGAGLGEGAARPQVGAGAVVVEDAQDLRGFLPDAERMRLHRGELGRLAGPDENGPLAQPQHQG